MIRETSKEIICPLDGIKKTVYIRTLVYDNKRYTCSNGCNQMHGSEQCAKCCAEDFSIVEITSPQDTK